MAKGKFSQPRMPKFDGSVPDQNQDPIFDSDDLFLKDIPDIAPEAPKAPASEPKPAPSMEETQQFTLEQTDTFLPNAKEPTLKLKLSTGVDSLKQSKVFIDRYRSFCNL